MLTNGARVAGLTDAGTYTFYVWAKVASGTRKVSLADATWIAAVKGLAAGSVNFALAMAIGSTLPPLPVIGGAMVLGLCAYGISLALFVVALRHLGTARTGAYFSIAPFFGAALAVALGDPVTWTLAIAGLLMAFGLWLHLTETHEHEHAHEAMDHEHEHAHDDGHHGHDANIRSFKEQAIGVPVFAALDGVVAAAHDGEPECPLLDRSSLTSRFSGGSCAFSASAAVRAFGPLY